MPDPNEYSDEDKWMEACVPTRISEGDDQEQAVAVCMNMWRDKGKKSVETEQAVKIGSRHSKADQDDIQEIHDRALKLGAVSPPQPKESEIISFPLGNYDTDKALVWFGDAVKALGDGKIGGYLIRFSSDEDPDLTGQYFTKDTDFGDLETGTVYYQHGLDEKLKMRKLGKSVHRQDEFGIWAETQLKMRDEYEKFIYSLAEAGKMGWSSGTAFECREPIFTACSVSALDKFPHTIAKYMAQAGDQAAKREVLKTQGLKKYPPATAANAPPVPYYIRGRGTQTKHGNRHDSERYGTQWYVEAKGLATEIGNRASYAQYLTWDNQAKVMARYGWRKIKDVLQEKRRQITDVYQAWVNKLIRDLGL